MEGTGSVLAMKTLDFGQKDSFTLEEREKLLKDNCLRFFSAREVGNIMNFPEQFGLSFKNACHFIISRAWYCRVAIDSNRSTALEMLWKFHQLPRRGFYSPSGCKVTIGQFAKLA